MSQSSERTALITGAARRIGRAIALDLAAHGWRVAIHYRRSQEDAQALAEEIKGAADTPRRWPPTSPTSTIRAR